MNILIICYGFRFIAFYMSQFIEIKDRLMDYRATHRYVLKGSISRISFSGTRSSSIIVSPQNQKYYRSKVSLRIQNQQKLASVANTVSLLTNLQKLKHNLHLYARSTSLKIQQVFGANNSQYWAKETPMQRKTSHSNTRSRQEDTVIFVDRKYNRQLAIKAAAVSQMQQIRKKKEQMRRSASYRHISPLTVEASRQLQSNNDTRPIINKQNPVLNIKVKNKLQKRQKVLKFNI